MTRPRGAGRRARIAAIAAAGLLAAGALAVVSERSQDPAPQPRTQTAERPRLMLLTALPIVFAEQFTIDGGGSPALSALETRYRVEPIAVADAASLKRGGLLLMAQPIAQPAEALVELDAWVRGGGRLLLLADPLLEWPSSRPLGDPLRPPLSFADTGLLRHWGLRLDSPDERGPRQLELGGMQVLTASPGVLVGTSCAIGRAGLVARCRIGKGKATIVADADFLNTADLDGPTEHNFDALLAELQQLGRN